ncbi:MAG: hypothetical protein Fur0024_1410 [Patescibacteria group bacterium]
MQRKKFFKNIRVFNLKITKDFEVFSKKVKNVMYKSSNDESKSILKKAKKFYKLYFANLKNVQAKKFKIETFNAGC